MKEKLLFSFLDRPANLAFLIAWRIINSLRSPAPGFRHKPGLTNISSPT